MNKQAEKDLVATCLVHEVDGEKRKELKLFNWEARTGRPGPTVWRLRVAYVLRPCEGEENYFTEFNAQGRLIAVRAKEKGGQVSILPTSTITCIILRCCLKVSVPQKVLEALGVGVTKPSDETKEHVVRRVDLGLFFSVSKAFCGLRGLWWGGGGAREVRWGSGWRK